MDEEMRIADEELSNPECDIKPDKIQYLIEKSYNLRRRAVSSPGFDVLLFLETYKHLSNYEMVSLIFVAVSYPETSYCYHL